jgi:hypothetical protein
MCLSVITVTALMPAEAPFFQFSFSLADERSNCLPRAARSGRQGRSGQSGLTWFHRNLIYRFVPKL